MPVDSLGFRLLRVAGALFTAFAMVFLSAPWQVHWLAWFAYVPFLWALREDSPRFNTFLAWLYGFASTFVLFSWIVHTISLFSNLGPFLAWTALTLFSAVFCATNLLTWPFVHPLRSRFGAWWVVLWPSLGALVEWASTRLILFPWNHGASQWLFPYSWQLVSVTGIWGLTWLIFFVNAGLVEGLYRWREGKPQSAVATVGPLAVLALVMAFGVWRYDQVEQQLRAAPVLRVAQLQSHNGMVERMEMTAQEAYGEWVNFTEALPPESVDLVVWPEGACPFHLNESKRASAQIAGFAKKGGFSMIIGSGAREKEGAKNRYFNSMYFVTPEKGVLGRYDKMIPLPFGEYLPLSGIFPFLNDLIEGPGDFRAGQVPVVADLGGLRVAAPICYEAILGYQCNLYEGPDLLVNVTNDAWFGDTSAPWQHAMLAAIRSTELGLPMVRSAYSGASMIVEPHGNVHSVIPPFTESVQIAQVRNAKVWTLYGALGDWFIAACVAALALAFGLKAWSDRQPKAP